jgi:hypothetical protein
MTLISNDEALAILALEKARESKDVVATSMAAARWAKVRAQEAFAALTDEQRAKGEALKASFASRFARMFVSPDNGKGRQTMYIATEEEIKEWNQSH